jgi:hypothetical protein
VLALFRIRKHVAAGTVDTSWNFPHHKTCKAVGVFFKNVICDSTYIIFPDPDILRTEV